MSYVHEPEEIDALGIADELARRASLAHWKFTREEHELFTKLHGDEFKTVYVEERDWIPDIPGNGPELGKRYQAWKHDMVRLYDSLKISYGWDYEQKVTEIIKDWDVAMAAKELGRTEQDVARWLDAAKSAEWKLRE